MGTGLKAHIKYNEAGRVVVVRPGKPDMILPVPALPHKDNVVWQNDRVAIADNGKIILVDMAHTELKVLDFGADIIIHASNAYQIIINAREEHEYHVIWTTGGSYITTHIVGLVCSHTTGSSFLQRTDGRLNVMTFQRNVSAMSNSTYNIKVTEHQNRLPKNTTVEYIADDMIIAFRDGSPNGTLFALKRLIPWPATVLPSLNNRDAIMAYGTYGIIIARIVSSTTIIVTVYHDTQLYMTLSGIANITEHTVNVTTTSAITDMTIDKSGDFIFLAFTTHSTGYRITIMPPSTEKPAKMRKIEEEAHKD